jgi:hypothetical protein
MNSHLTHCGIPGIGPIPYGLHLCHFYPTRAELLDALIPYFQAGVQNNEQCIWVAADPLDAGAVRSEIAKYSALKESAELGQMIIKDALEWYGDPSNLKTEDDIIQLWTDAEAKALATGFAGLRITANKSFITRDGWHHLMNYEKKLHETVQGRRIVVCCSYHRLRCEPVDMIEVVRRHDAALERSDDNWQVYTQSSLQNVLITKNQRQRADAPVPGGTSA